MGERRGDGGQGSVLEETEMKCIAVQCGVQDSYAADDGGCRERDRNRNRIGVRAISSIEGYAAQQPMHVGLVAR